MLATEVKTTSETESGSWVATILTNGFTVLKSKALIKYNLLTLTKIKVFTPKGEFFYAPRSVCNRNPPNGEIIGQMSKTMRTTNKKITSPKQLKKKTVKRREKLLFDRRNKIS